jgi:hypothetical protein
MAAISIISSNACLVLYGAETSRPGMSGTGCMRARATLRLGGGHPSWMGYIDKLCLSGIACLHVEDIAPLASRNLEV